MISINKNWHSFRIYLLLVLLGSILATLGKISFFPGNSKMLDQKFSFPSSINLPQWQFIFSTSLKPLTQRYGYRRGDQTMMIDAHSEFRTDGNVSRFLMVYYHVKPATVEFTEKYQPNQGHITFFKIKDRAFMSACLNPVGESTVTEQQFVSNYHKFGWSIGRTLMWLIGQEDLLNTNCLWTVISSPLPSSATDSNVQQTYRSLEQAWFDWVNFWKKH